MHTVEENTLKYAVIRLHMTKTFSDIAARMQGMINGIPR